MEAILRLSTALLRADTRTRAVRGAVQICFEHARVPVVGVLPDRSGAGWYVAASRGVGGKDRAEIARVIAGVSALGRNRSTRNRLAASFGRVVGRGRAEAIPAGQAVLLAVDVRSEHRTLLRSAGSLLAEAMERVGAVGWAQLRNDHLDLALACTAHELRGPLVGARAALDHVQVDDPGPETIELLRQTRDELEQLADLVDPLLRWSAGPNQLSKRWVDLVGIVNDTVNSCRLEFEDAEVVVRAPDGLFISADARHLRGAIGNVVRNALSYAPPGSVVRVDVGTDDEIARVRVRDRGPGVPVADQHMIFDPFVRGRESRATRSGKGLGLFIARRIIDAHGGSIGMRPVRQGAEFCIELPLPVDGSQLSAS